MSTILNYETEKMRTSDRCPCGGDMKRKYALINGKLTKIANCENCGRVELADIRITPNSFRALRDNAS
jgi:hypothetical protein